MEPAGTCDTSVPGQVTCVLTSPLDAGANATIFLTATAANAGLMVNQAIVVSAQTDPNFLNNFATEETMVMARKFAAGPPLVCKNPQVDIDGPAVAELMADVATAVSRQAAAVSEQVYEVILRDIPGALGTMSGILGSKHANIVNLQLVHRDGSFHTFNIDVEVHDLAHLHAIIAALREADPISSVERI